MRRQLSAFFLCCAFLLSSLVQAAQARFDSIYFFQSEEALLEKKVDFRDLARYSRNLQSAVSKVLKNAKIPQGNGYIVVAVRADQAMAVWLDMEPVLHEYYDYEIGQAIKKLRPFTVDKGVVVFAIKMAIDTAKHSTKAVPLPASWIATKQKLTDPSDIEALVMAMWPEA
ncbi:MAG: hypothetical protein K2P84_05960 [Undibacterium sp.]|nr:hypothetical protein [Undibacterium sp.]